MFKRIGLLILANLAVFVVLSVVLSIVQMVFGLNFGTMAGSNLNLSTLFIFSMVVGFTGSVISLLMSKTMAKMTMGLSMIDTDRPQPGLEAYLVDVVRRQSQQAGIPMPEVAIYDGEPNAFATGASKSSSLVAVSTGLLNLMDRQEVEAVIGHELSHVNFLGSDKRINPGFTSVASYERQPKLSPVFGRTRWVSGSNCMIAQRLLFHPSPTKVSRLFSMI